LNPSRSWRVGEPRSSPTGKPLEGKNRDTFWTAPISEGAWPGEDLPAAMRKIADRLSPHRSFFHRIRTEGGSIEFFVGWFLENMAGDNWDCELLAQIADLKIDLSLCLYPPEPALPPSETV
ncbi:MAG TPA: DUF4279 domain-containing protein, partial [Xanthobacteraceae bacterium]